jgi:hypothetical protein
MAGYRFNRQTITINDIVFGHEWFGMRLPETRDLFARNMQFPATKEDVIEAVGETELDAPPGREETIGDVIERCEVEEFRSADDLYDTLMTFVSDAFIGRKYYDDRGTSIKSDDDEVHL